MTLRLLWPLLLFSIGCSTTQNLRAGRMAYSKTARLTYQRAMREYQSRNFFNAIRYFTAVKRRFPYSRWAVLAELRIADSQMKQGRHLQAIDAYKLFIRFHPTNRDVPYCQYMIARAHFEQGPGDWLLLPPSYEKDLSAVHDGRKEILKFLERYPGSGLVPKAKKLLQKIERQLANHELYVAKFYASKDKFVATKMRLEYIRKVLKTMKDDPEVVFLLGSIYWKLRKRTEARSLFASLRKNSPNSTYAKKASAYLK